MEEQWSDRSQPGSSIQVSRHISAVPLFAASRRRHLLAAELLGIQNCCASSRDWVPLSLHVLRRGVDVQRIHPSARRRASCRSPVDLTRQIRRKRSAILRSQLLRPRRNERGDSRGTGPLSTSVVVLCAGGHPGQFFYQDLGIDPQEPVEDGVHRRRSSERLSSQTHEKGHQGGAHPGGGAALPRIRSNPGILFRARWPG